MDEHQLPKKIGGFLERFQNFIPTDRRVRITIQAYITNILELNETLPRDSIRCTGKTIFISVHPYLKREIISHAGEILTLLREKDHLFFEYIR